MRRQLFLLFKSLFHKEIEFYYHLLICTYESWSITPVYWMYSQLICWTITYYIIVHAVSNYQLFCRSCVMITSSIIPFVIILSNVIWKLIFYQESVVIFQFNLDIIQELHLFLDYLHTEKFLTKYESDRSMSIVSKISAALVNLSVGMTDITYQVKWVFLTNICSYLKYPI